MRAKIGKLFAGLYARSHPTEDISLSDLSGGGKVLLIPHSPVEGTDKLDRDDVMRLADVLHAPKVVILARPGVDVPRPQGRIKLVAYDAHDEGFFGGPKKGLVERVRDGGFAIGIDLEPRDSVFAASLLLRAGIHFRVGTSRMIDAPYHNVRIPLDPTELGRLSRLTDALEGVVRAVA
jgi:hypothetical protein